MSYSAAHDVGLFPKPEFSSSAHLFVGFDTPTDSSRGNSCFFHQGHHKVLGLAIDRQILPPYLGEELSDTALEMFVTVDGHLVSGAIKDREQGVIEGILRDGEYCLSVPLPYEISKGDTNWVGYLPSLDLPAYGDTPEEVVEDLQRAIVEYHEILFRHNDAELGEIPKRHKTILSGILERRPGKVANRKKEA